MSTAFKIGPISVHRLRLRRWDGLVHLDRGGIGIRPLGIYIHRMSAPDPGLDLHDHPWSFVSIVLVGGYTEVRAPCRDAVPMASTYAAHPDMGHPGEIVHRIVELDRRHCWTLVIRGPRRRRWGFYLPDGYVDHHEYETHYGERRRLSEEQKQPST